jgi:hypothetical protein
MSIQDLHNALRSRFNTTFVIANSQQANVAWPNYQFDPSGKDVWFIFTVLTNTADFTEIGSSKNQRTEGMVVVQVMSKLNVGDGAVQEWVDKVIATFRQWSSGGITFRMPYPVPVGRADDEYGAWWQTNVNCPFFHDEVS